MKFNPLMVTTLALAGFAVAAPAMAASEYPLVPGEYEDVSMITVDDGHDLDYAKVLAGKWRASQEYAKSQGWITSYEIDVNVNKRPGEPDYYLVTYFKSMPDAAEMQKRDDAYMAYMKTTDSQMQAESGQRATYRHVVGSMLLQKLEWAK